MSTIAFNTRNLFNPRSSLTKALQENRGTYTISKDGYVSLDLSNNDVKKAIAKEIQKLDSIKEEKR